MGGREVPLICHMAVLSGQHRRNTLPAIEECFAASAGRIELDIHSLDGEDYAVFHDRRLETHTTGRGPIGAATPDEVRAARFVEAPAEHPPLLSEVVEMVRGCRTELQLDLKDWRAMSRERLLTLSRVVDPVKDRIIVSTGQDWNLARLHRAAPEVAIGFDPGLYLDHAIEGDQIYLPRAMGAYRYRDDHPMAFGRTESTVDYLRERMEMLVMQVPAAREFFMSFRLVLQMLGDGFNPARWLHERNIDANVWTADHRGAESVRWIERLVAAGIDRITTNTATAWVEAFRREGAAPAAGYA